MALAQKHKENCKEVTKKWKASHRSSFINELNPTLNTKEEWGNSNKLRERRTEFEPIDLSNLRSKNCQRTQHSGDSSILTEAAAGGLRKF